MPDDVDELDRHTDTYEEIAIRLVLAEEALENTDLDVARIHIRWARHWHDKERPQCRG